MHKIYCREVQAIRKRPVVPTAVWNWVSKLDASNTVSHGMRTSAKRKMPD